MRKLKIMIFLLVFLCLLTPYVCSYAVTPGKWEVYMYEDYEITPQKKLVITIDNYHNVSMKIRLSVFTNPDTLKEGYELLPEEGYGWIQFAETDFVVPAKTKHTIPLIVDVPNATENYNKNWQFYIFVDQYAGGASEGTAVFQYDYNLLWTIKTPPRYIPPNERMDADVNYIFYYVLPGIIFVTIVIFFIYKKHFSNKIKIEKNFKRKPKHKKIEYNDDVFQ